MNTLCKLILEHLYKAGKYSVADAVLFIELREMTSPRSTDLDWKNATKLLLKGKLIAEDRDELTNEKMFYITKAGQIVHRRRNEEQGT